MPIYDLFIYDRYGQVLLHKIYNQTESTQNNAKRQNERAKLFFGLVYTLQSFTAKFDAPATSVTTTSSSITPIPVTLPTTVNSLSFSTPQYKVNFYAAPTGLKFLMTTDETCPLNATSNDILKQIYRLFVDYVLSTPYSTQGMLLDSIPVMFERKLKQLLEM